MSFADYLYFAASCLPTCRGYADDVRMQDPDSDRVYLNHLEHANLVPPPLPPSPGQGVLRPVGGDPSGTQAMELGSIPRMTAAEEEALLGKP